MTHDGSVNNMDIPTSSPRDSTDDVTPINGLQRIHDPARHCVQPAVRAACCRGIRYDDDGTRRVSGDDDVIDYGRAADITQHDRVTG